MSIADRGCGGVEMGLNVVAIAGPELLAGNQQQAIGAVPDRNADFR
jgi:hypothetical protein